MQVRFASPTVLLSVFACALIGSSTLASVPALADDLCSTQVDAAIAASNALDTAYTAESSDMDTVTSDEAAIAVADSSVAIALAAYDAAIPGSLDASTLLVGLDTDFGTLSSLETTESSDESTMLSDDSVSATNESAFASNLDDVLACFSN
jgi:hypothetical protein